MSENSSQDRTEAPTPKRLREARKQGQVPRSRELTTALVMLAACALLLMGGRAMVESAALSLRDALRFDAETLAQPAALPARLMLVLGEGLLHVLPLLLITVLAALLAPLLIGGWNMSWSAAAPQLSRLNPFSGLGRMFSAHSAAELGKSLAKFGLLALIAILFARTHLDELRGLAQEPLHAALAHGGSLCLAALTWMCGGLFLIAAVDAPLQLWNYRQNLRMTKQQVRDEMKESEGRPEVKARVRRLQLEMARKHMMEAVPKADVIITNPTHYAVALRYNAGKMRAPRVVAKGADVLALAIRELAARHHIPRVEAPPLARALYRSAELEMEIPVHLYKAVAQVLSYVYQLRTARPGAMPTPPEVGDVPGGEPDTTP